MPRPKATHAVFTWYVRPKAMLLPFPIDMMRYDNCTPHSETDSYVIANTHANHVRMGREQSWVVAIDQFFPADRIYPKLTQGRWESFGWTACTNEEIERYLAHIRTGVAP